MQVHAVIFSTFFYLYLQNTFILEERLFLIFFSHKNPLLFAVANAITFFLSKVWSIDIIKENKTHQKNTPYCSILTSNGNHIKDSWGCYICLLRQFWVIVCSSYLFRFPEVWERAKNEPQKTEVPHRWIQYPLQFITSVFWGVHISQIGFFWDIKHILQFLST